MTSIQGHEYSYRKRFSKNLSKSLPLPGSDYNKFSVNFFLADPIVNHVIGPSRSPVAKYTKENLQIILKTILEA